MRSKKNLKSKLNPLRYALARETGEGAAQPRVRAISEALFKKERVEINA